MGSAFPLEILISPAAAASQNMAQDEALLVSLASRPRCVIHFYRWKYCSATYGYFIDPHKHLRIEGIQKWQLQLERRPTGGGIIFHQHDMAFSVLIPSKHPAFTLNILESYHVINTAVSEAIKDFRKVAQRPALLPDCSHANDRHCLHFCMAKPTKYDIMIDGRKVGGGAQRRTKHGLLHQGSISLTMPSEEFLNDVLLLDTQVAASMQHYSYPLLGSSVSEQELNDARHYAQALIISAFDVINCTTKPH